MAKAKIIVGANFGDEGKGSITYHYTKQALKNNEKVLNILTNGGSQRGHSIVTNKGDFTVKHFGASTILGVDNYYSEYFILNPMQFVKEYKDLFNRLGILPPIYYDPKCKWSTPYDVMANIIDHELDLKYNGNEGFNTCGMGIWKTVERYSKIYNISFIEFISLDDDKKKLYLNMVKTYFENILQDIPNRWKPIWNSDILMENFLRDCEFMKFNAIPHDFNSLIDYYDTLIFENGQGMLLGEKVWFDGTPSDTSCNNAITMLKDFNENIDIHYITRSYLTRHGFGGYVGCYGTSKIDKKLYDNHNTFNEYQGEFQYRMLNIKSLCDRVFEDSKDVKHNKTYIEVTHCDELDISDILNKHVKENKYPIEVNYYGNEKY